MREIKPGAARTSTLRAHPRRSNRASGDAQNVFSLETTIYNKPGFLARRLQQIGVSIFLRETENFGITPLQYGVMAAVRAFPGDDQITVASRVGLDRTTVLGIVDRLERKGLLKRTINSKDRRVRQLFLTEAGQHRIEEMRGGTERAQTRLLEALNEKEYGIFLSLLKRIVAHHNDDTRVPVNDAAMRATITGKPRT